jgi:hypothetical protein
MSQTTVVYDGKQVWKSGLFSCDSKAGGVSQVVKHQPSKHEALSSNPSAKKKKSPLILGHPFRYSTNMY